MCGTMRAKYEQTGCMHEFVEINERNTKLKRKSERGREKQMWFRGDGEKRRSDCSQTINFNSILSSIIRKSYPEKGKAKERAMRECEDERKIMSWLVGPSTTETILSLYKYHYYIVFSGCCWYSLRTHTDVFLGVHARLRHTQNPAECFICVLLWHFRKQHV